jgi:hypothetical protein
MPPGIAPRPEICGTDLEADRVECVTVTDTPCRLGHDERVHGSQRSPEHDQREDV